MRKRIGPLRPARRCGDHVQITPLAVASTSRMMFKNASCLQVQRDARITLVQAADAPGGWHVDRKRTLDSAVADAGRFHLQDAGRRTQDAGTRGRGSTTTDIACTILRLVLIYRLRSIGIVLSPISLLWGRKPPRVHSPPSLVLILVASPHQAFQVPPSSYRKIRHWVSATYL
jgi:hypothetical protein